MGVQGSHSSRVSCQVRETRRALWQWAVEPTKARILGRRRWFFLFPSTALGSSTRVSAGGEGAEEGGEEEAAGPVVALALPLAAGDPRKLRLRGTVFS